MRAFALVSLCSRGFLSSCDDQPEMPLARARGHDRCTRELDAVEMSDGSIGIVLVHGASTSKELW